MRKEIDYILAAGIIEPFRSEWAAPIVLVNKKDSTTRMCVDYRRLNAASLSDAYPMPRIEDLIDGLGKAKFITTLDLSQGYWQVPMAEGARHLTAFTTPIGLYQFRVMPFGLKGAPATFQCLMDKVLQGLQGFSAAYMYIDDLAIHSDSWDNPLQHVRTVLQRLWEAGLTAKPPKYQFGMDQCVYLGYVVGNGVIQPESIASGMPKSSKSTSALPPKMLLQTPPVDAPNPADQDGSLQEVLHLVRAQEKEVQALRSTVESQNATIAPLMEGVEKVI